MRTINAEHAPNESPHQSTLLGLLHDHPDKVLCFHVSDEEWDAATRERELWEQAPPRERHYLDGPDHGSPNAESAYRQGYRGGYREAVELLTIESDDPPTLHELIDDAQAARWRVFDEAAIGEHTPRFRPGHEVQAAKVRGRHQALEQVMWLVSHVDDFNQLVGPLVNWSCTLTPWADDDSGKFIPPPALPIIVGPENERDAPPNVLPESDFVEVDKDDDSPPIEHVGKFPVSLLSVPGFVGRFIEYCVATAKRAQPELALANAIAVLGTLIGRKLCDRVDSRANVFIVALAGTGSGKEHSRHCSKMLLVAIHRDNLFVESFASAPAIVNRVADHLDVLALVDEFGRYLKISTGRNAESYLAGITTVMLKLYSSSNSIYVGDCYADSKRNEAKIIAAPNLNVFGTTVRDNFFAALSSENALDGLLNRFLIFQVSDALPSLQDVEPRPLPESLIEDARYWAELVVGHGDLSKTNPTPMLVEETPEASARFREFSEHCDAVARKAGSLGSRGLWVRSYEKARKLALLYAASESREPRITLAAVEWAIGFVLHCTGFVEQAAGAWISDTPHQANVKKIMRLIDQAGRSGLSQSDLYRQLDHVLKGTELASIIRELHDVGRIQIEEIKTSGRSRHQIVSTRFKL